MDPRSNMFQTLVRLKNLGFSPSGIIDAGAYQGEFSLACRNIFPSSEILMIDALQENEEYLSEMCNKIGNAKYKITLLGENDEKEVPFFVVDTVARPELVKTGSSKYRENNNFPMEDRKISQEKLSNILDQLPVKFNFIKLDVQGAELDVIKGMENFLDQIEVILIEMSVLNYNINAPLIHEVQYKLGQLGFVLYEIADIQRLDGYLNQIDGIFVRLNSDLRPKPPFRS